MSTIRANVGGGNVTGRMRGGNLDLQIVPWLNYSVPGVANLLVLSATTLLSIYCYICCVIADPGRVPPDYQPDLESPSGIVQVKKNGTTRFCQKCKNYKPPRCHHCRVCQKCVLRMDHHCPWINNCVGHYNYRVFLLFLIYVNAALVHAVGLLVTHALHVIRDRSGPDGFRGVLHRVYDADDLASSSNRPFIWAMVQTLAMSLAVPLELGLLMLLCWHAYLSLENKTTIEYHEGVTATLRASRQGRLYRHPYNMGVVNNLHAILGPHLLCWLIPGQLSVEGVGLKYTTRMELGNFDALVPDGKQPDSAPPSLAAAVMRPGASGMASQAFPSSPLKTS